MTLAVLGGDGAPPPYQAREMLRALRRRLTWLADTLAAENACFTLYPWRKMNEVKALSWAIEELHRLNGWSREEWLFPLPAYHAVWPAPEVRQ